MGDEGGGGEGGGHATEIVSMVPSDDSHCPLLTDSSGAPPPNIPPAASIEYRHWPVQSVPKASSGHAAPHAAPLASQPTAGLEL